MTEREELLNILQNNQNLQLILSLTKELGIDNWYVGSGSIAQTVWNIKHDFNPENGIKDYDLVYYDEDISYEAEDLFIKKGKELFKDILVPVEIRNQARVHLWYKKNFGYPVKQHISTEDAISTWPTTATAVGVRKNKNGEYEIYAPFGLTDLLNMVVRPNKVKITEQIYQEKVDRWIRVWSNLKIIPWLE